MIAVEPRQPQPHELRLRPDGDGYVRLHAAAGHAHDRRAVRFRGGDGDRSVREGAGAVHRAEDAQGHDRGGPRVRLRLGDVHDRIRVDREGLHPADARDPDLPAPVVASPPRSHPDPHGAHRGSGDRASAGGRSRGRTGHTAPSRFLRKQFGMYQKEESPVREGCRHKPNAASPSAPRLRSGALPTMRGESR